MSIGAKIGAGFAVGLVIIVAIGVSAYVSTQRLLEANRWVTHTHEVLEGLEHVLSVLTDAETGQRGFVLTGEERYLEPYHAATGQVQHDIDDAGRTDPRQPGPAREPPAGPQARRRQAGRTAETIQLRRKSGLEAALPVVLTDRGKKIMDDLRGVVAEMETREQQLLDERNAAADASRRPHRLDDCPLDAARLAGVGRCGRGPDAHGAIRRPRRAARSRRKSGRGIAIRYVSAVVAVAVAVVLRWRLEESFGPLPLFITFYPAVLLVASIGGGGPGIVATVLSALAADYWFIQPYGSFGIEAPE